MTQETSSMITPINRELKNVQSRP